MYIKDECGILERIIKLVRKEEFKEHGALARGSIIEKEKCEIYCLIDNCMVEEVGGEEQTNHVRIPAKLSYALLQSCKRESMIPVVIHTHARSYQGMERKTVSFSLPDMSFMEKFAFCAEKMGNIPECLFIVTDGESIQYCRWKLSTMDYALEEEVLSGDA